jgi:hypothetical protein
MKKQQGTAVRENTYEHRCVVKGCDMVWYAQKGPPFICVRHLGDPDAKLNSANITPNRIISNVLAHELDAPGTWLATPWTTAEELEILRESGACKVTLHSPKGSCVIVDLATPDMVRRILLGLNSGGQKP